MNRLSYAALTAGLVLGALLLGSHFGQKRSSSTSASASARKILYYVDPMNPAHTSPEPGRAPCGMDLEPVYADAGTSTPAAPGLTAVPAGTVRIPLEKQQLLGVRTGQVERKPLHYTRRLPGRVVVDETRVYWINATVDGWITKTSPHATGDFVQSNQVLAAFYSPQFLSAGNALLFALNAQDRAGGATPGMPAEDSRRQQFDRNLQQYADALKNLGMGDSQIREMIETRKFRQNVDIVAPADGVILARNVSDGLRFEQGTELYRIANLKRVWILADVFEKDAEMIQAGRKVRVFWAGRQRSALATISAALPRFDPASRTLKVRLEMDNPDYALQPEMFVDLEFPVEIPESLFIPADALVDTGRRQSVFVHRGQGCFEPRAVKTGRRFGDRVEILCGIEPGESIVVAGTFLVDSESRMKLAAAENQGTTATDPVCHMTVEESEASAAKRLSEHHGTTYYFCGELCKRRFDEDADKFLKSETEPSIQTAAHPAEAMASGPEEHGEESAVTGAVMSTPLHEMPDPAREGATLAALDPAARVTANPEEMVKSETAAVDPVCGMKVEAETARRAGRASLHQGTNYFFCTAECQRNFDEDPDWVLKEITARRADSSGAGGSSSPTPR